MLTHLDVVPPRRRWSQRIGWWRDLSERLLLRGTPGDGDLVAEVDVCVAVDDMARSVELLLADTLVVWPPTASC
jgi:hypothetical protein